MAKSIIKEIIIMLLLCVAILLILGIMFYNYIPTNKVVPAKATYETPENVKEEINEEITELEKTEISYEITDSDLNIYKQSKSYKAGKKDPFSLKKKTAKPKNNSVAGGSTSSVDNSGDTENEETTVKDKNSTGTFFDDDGTK